MDFSNLDINVEWKGEAEKQEISKISGYFVRRDAGTKFKKCSKLSDD